VKEALIIIVALMMFSYCLGVLVTHASSTEADCDKAAAAIAADLAEQGYTLQRVETVGEGARWIVVEVGQ